MTKTFQKKQMNLKIRVKNGETLNQIFQKLFALVREASKEPQTRKTL